MIRKKLKDEGYIFYEGVPVYNSDTNYLKFLEWYVCDDDKIINSPKRRDSSSC